MNIHPACAAWPRPSDAVVQEMAASIKAEGLHNPIWLTREGEILDGKTRLEACEIAGVEPRFQTYEGDDYQRFTIAQNARRRHLEAGMLTLIVAALAKITRGGDRRSTEFKVVATTLKDGNKAMDDLADAAGLSRITVVKGKALLDHGEPNVIDMVRSGEVGVVNAALYAKNTPRDQQRAATPSEVKKKGAALRTPNKGSTASNPQNITSANYVRRPPTVSRPALPAEELARIRAMPEKMVSIHVLIEELHPLFERLMTQAKVHIVRVSQGELGMIASHGQRLLEQWASDDPTVRRMRGRVVPFKQPAIRKKG